MGANLCIFFLTEKYVDRDVDLQYHASTVNSDCMVIPIATKMVELNGNKKNVIVSISLLVGMLLAVATFLVRRRVAS